MFALQPLARRAGTIAGHTKMKKPPPVDRMG